MTICIDSNILIYAFNTESKYYNQSQNFLEKHIQSGGIAISDISVIEFYQIITNNKILDNPLTEHESNKIIQDLLNDPRIDLLQLDISILKHVFKTAARYEIRKYEIYDHIIANLCKFNNIKKFYTVNTKDFQKYKYLDIINPFE
jgi:predicted nucleic acid-binding protein